MACVHLGCDHFFVGVVLGCGRVCVCGGENLGCFVGVLLVLCRCLCVCLRYVLNDRAGVWGFACVCVAFLFE